MVTRSTHSANARRPRQKPKMEVILTKSDNFEEAFAAEAKEEEARRAARAAAAESQD